MLEKFDLGKRLREKRFWKKRFWKNDFGKKRFWKKATLEKPILGKNDFGKTELGKTILEKIGRPHHIENPYVVHLQSMVVGLGKTDVGQKSVLE